MRMQKHVRQHAFECAEACGRTRLKRARDTSALGSCELPLRLHENQDQEKNLWLSTLEVAEKKVNGCQRILHVPSRGPTPTWRQAHRHFLGRSC